MKPFLYIFKVHGHSMLPTFPPGHYVLTSSVPLWFRKPQVGDVVVVADPKNKTCLLKRITKVKGGQFWVEGDNTQGSRDSRSFGWITQSAIVGKIVYY